MKNLDPRIGVLNSGKYYAFVNGYDAPETLGTLEEVEIALGIRAPAAPRCSAPRKISRPTVFKTYNVLLRLQYPAWNEVDGIEYPGIRARSKSEANKIVRRRAADDGHTVGTGRATFTATEISDE